MAKTKVLITVKTYPTLSTKYDELVCTAGIKEDGSWIRIYPIPFRKLGPDERYKKWQWIEMELVKNNSDPRKESYRPYNIDDDIILGEEVGTSNNWAQRKSIILKDVKTNMEDLIAEAKNPDIGTSLAILKPKEVIDFICKPTDRNWDQDKLKAIIARQQQGNLFEENNAEQIFKIVDKLPYEFSYRFTTEDGKVRTLMIEDWELGSLYWNCLKRANGDEKIACQKVKEKYWDQFVMGKDLYFILGTTQRFHSTGKNPFIIIGVFYPPKEKPQQPSLFDF